MKKLLMVILTFLLFSSIAFAKDVYVNGYYRKDGTYVRPHYRSSPDGAKSNNYGKASYQQRQQYQYSPVIPSYRNDYDKDGTPNRYDYDDDNDGVSDDYDSSQYGRGQKSQPYTYAPSYSPSYSPSYDSYGSGYNSYGSDSKSSSDYGW